MKMKTRWRRRGTRCKTKRKKIKGHKKEGKGWKDLRDGEEDGVETLVSEIFSFYDCMQDMFAYIPSFCPFLTAGSVIGTVDPLD